MYTNRLKGRKILVVEDDFSSRLYLNKILEKAGATLFNAADGMEAVKIISENPEVNIVLMDIQLPIMDGYMAAKKIREIRQNTIIIAQTAYGYRGDRDKIISSGFNDYLIKPIYANVLVEKIITAINASEDHSG